MKITRFRAMMKCLRNGNLKWFWWHLLGKNIFEESFKELKKRGEI